MARLGNIYEQLQHSEKFDRKMSNRGQFWQSSGKRMHLAKLLMHSNNRLIEPTGREVRNPEPNVRFNYKESLEEP